MYIYIYIYIHTYIHIYVCMYVCMHIHVHTYRETERFVDTSGSPGDRHIQRVGHQQGVDAMNRALAIVYIYISI